MNDKQDGPIAMAYLDGPAPLCFQGFDEPFGLAVGSRGIEPGALDYQPQGLAGLPPGLGAVGAAVIREHPLALNTLTAKPGHSPDQETDRGGLLLIGQDLGVS
jgi:hypothetical protein